MIYPKTANKVQISNPEKQQKNVQEHLAILLAFLTVFIFFIKILFL